MSKIPVVTRVNIITLYQTNKKLNYCSGYILRVSYIYPGMGIKYFQSLKY